MKTQRSTWQWACACGLIMGHGIAGATPPSEPPAEGALFRELFGSALESEFGIKVHGVAQVGYATNTATTTDQSRYGSSNNPVVLSNSEGLQFNLLGLLIEKPIATNVIPRVTPLPGPVPQSFSWGFTVEATYGPNALPGMVYGFESGWGINRQPSTNAPGSLRESYLAMPHVMAQFYLPVGYGMALTLGRFGSGVGYEIPGVWRPSPNFFYSRTYALVAQPDLVVGGLLSANLVRSDAGLLAGEFGLVNGRQNLQDNNSSKSLIGALRYRTADMKTGISYAVYSGNDENSPGHQVQMPTARLISDRGQRRTQQSLLIQHALNERTNLAMEVVSGKQAGDGRASTIDIIGGPGFTGASWNGVNVHANWRASSTLAYGVRVETFNDKDGFALFPVSTVKGRFNAVTIGTRYDFSKYVTLRPELRHDWQSHDGANAFGGGRERRQTTFSVDAVVNF